MVVAGLPPLLGRIANPRPDLLEIKGQRVAIRGKFSASICEKAGVLAHETGKSHY
jgi:hypothetical protein